MVDNSLRTLRIVGGALLSASVLLAVLVSPIWVIGAPLFLALAWPPAYGPQFVLEGWKYEEAEEVAGEKQEQGIDVEHIEKNKLSRAA